MTGPELTGWGRFPRAASTLETPRDEAALARLVAGGPVIARGAGRAYGDSAVAPGITLDMRHFNRMLSFDPSSGRLVAEAGVTLDEIIATFLPRGWFPTVTPGTRFVTLGGAIAADVHGKNHHRDGSFGATLDWVDLMGPDGSVRRCGPGQDPDLFGWTLGGMGLTGIVLRASLRLSPVETGWIRQTTRVAGTLDAAMEAFETGLDAPYSVAWIDCTARGGALGRSLVYLGWPATRSEIGNRPRFPLPRRRISVPFTSPLPLFGRLSAPLLNRAYFRRGARGDDTSLVDWDSYFYPLDAIGHWNRLYGPRGFMQFQCALPLEHARAGLHALLEQISQSGQASTLSVLKRFGPQNSPVSFPMEGYTLALDFPRNKATQALLPRLDRIVLDHGGRFYLAKDSRMSAATLEQSDPRMAAFARWRRQTGRAGRFVSVQSERLDL